MDSVYMNSLLKFLFVSLFFALVVFAVDFDDAHALRSKLDPIMLPIEGVANSMIGPCIKGTDQNPFMMDSHLSEPIPMDLCVVYIVKEERLIPHLRKEFKKMNIKSSVAVRFQKI